MNARNVFAVLLVLVACAGCAASSGTAGPTAGAADFSRIVAGKTTKDEVRAMFGVPARAHQYRAESGETWEYPYYGNYERRIFWVEYASNGVVSKTDDTLDFYAGKYKGW
jgi:outer membrane protein assembly factor BamE (lipoprotein component of BamABCDE complex)